MTASELNEQFGMTGVLGFEEHGELTRARVTLPTCEGTIYLQGAHLTHWQLAGEKPALFLSAKALFAEGKPIRGGVPICFPWFGARSDGKPGPAHGFARTQPWELSFAALLPDREEGDRLQLTFVLGPSAMSKSLGFDNFRAVYEVMFGRTLAVKLTVANLGEEPLRFEEALHTYFAVGDVRQSAIAGIDGALYLDKRDEGREKRLTDGPWLLEDFTDRVFPANNTDLAIDDRVNERTLKNTKEGSATTVVWNPWPEGSAGFADLRQDEWERFLCVETANTATDAITLEPGSTHSMRATISVVKPGRV